MKATEIILKRQTLSQTITSYWGIIKSENKINKNQKRNYDIKAVYDRIKTSAEERILIKLYQQCINMGYKSTAEMPKDCLFPLIFQLAELQEQNVQLNLIPTLDPNKKITKGKKQLPETEEMTSAFIAKERATINLKINEIKKKISEFNDKKELIIKPFSFQLV